MPLSPIHSPLAAPPPYPAWLIDIRAPRRRMGATRRLLLRPVLPQDAPLLADLLAGLSGPTRRRRFHGAVRPSPETVQRLCSVDARRELALLITADDGCREYAVADARYVIGADGETAEMALVVADAWQRQGLGRWALDGLATAARAAGVRWLQGDVLDDNTAVLALARQAGFTAHPGPDDGTQRVMRALDAAVPAPRPAWLRGAWAWPWPWRPAPAPAPTSGAQPAWVP